jgi:hypothetical protein
MLGALSAAWGGVAVVTSILDFRDGIAIDVWNDATLQGAFLGAGAALIIGSLRKYRGGWSFLAGVFLANFGTVVAGTIPKDLAAGVPLTKALSPVVLAYIISGYCLLRAHRQHQSRASDAG